MESRIWFDCRDGIYFFAQIVHVAHEIIIISSWTIWMAKYLQFVSDNVVCGKSRTIVIYNFLAPPPVTYASRAFVLFSTVSSTYDTNAPAPTASVPVRGYCIVSFTSCGEYQYRSISSVSTKRSSTIHNKMGTRQRIHYPSDDQSYWHLPLTGHPMEYMKL